MSATELRQTFRQRFRAVTRQIWSLHVSRGVASTVMAATALVTLATAADFIFELQWGIRAAIMIVGLAIITLLALKWIIRPARAWNRARVAAELEGLFPRIGQRLRTASQHGERSADELAHEGVAPGLVAALEEETATKTKSLPFQAALPVRPALIYGVLAIVFVSAVVLAAMWVPEWMTAMQRVGLSPTSYTTLTVTPSAKAVNEGTDVDIRVTMTGRNRPAVVMNFREASEPTWRQETMEPKDGEYSFQLASLRQTTEFFVTAGPERTPVQQIVVRHALKIVGAGVDVMSPAYTGLGIVKHESGSFPAVQGSTAKMRFDLDRAPVEATLVVKDSRKKDSPERRLDMAVQDRQVSIELPLTEDMEYTVEARDSEGMPLAANKHRIRVTRDQPPSVWFETPSEGLEVHTLAELMFRVRARDDFGLSKVAVVFQINNEEERTLVLEDVKQPNQRDAMAEQILMLEQFLLTQKDCVAYYAFAEDNRPDGIQRTTTELRFIDIRPFLRTYKLREPGEPMPGGQQRDLIFLDEVIARQRFNLNQTMRLETHAKVAIDKLLPEVEKTAAFENKLATQTHNLADFLIEKALDGAAILAQAEEAMLSAVDSLNGGKFTTAINQERDALRYLMEARNTIEQDLFKKPPKVRAQARAFDRLQRQKLRMKRDTESLAQIAEELGKLATEEEEVARTIAGNMDGPTGKPMPEDSDPDNEPKKRKGKDPAQDRQDDIAGRASAVETIAEKTKGLPDLAKNRIREAAKTANAGADALGQGDRPAARKEVDRAKELFRATAKQVAALAADEAVQQLAAARDLANEIALQTAPREPMNKSGAGGGKNEDKKMPVPGGMGEKEKGEKKMPGLGGAAEDAKTLKDLLEKLAGSGAEADADAASKAAAILKQEDLATAISRLEKPGASDDRGERQDLADRFAALTQKLDQAYRETLAPRLEQLAKLEREANDLKQRTAAADDESDWRRLRQQGASFIEKLEAAGLGDIVGEDLKSGVGNGLNGRETFTRGIASVHMRLVAKIQDFVAGDRLRNGNEAVPPEYKDLVERYLRALSAGGSK